jgi:DNA-binding beta-propeller fold protein YncE
MSPARNLGAALLAALAAAGMALALAAGPAAAATSHPFLFAIHKWVPEPNVVEYFEAPCGVTVDSSGDLYASDYYHDNVDVFGPGGSLLTRIRQVEPLDGPCGLAVGASGELFVNVFHRNVTRFTPSSFPPAPTTAYGAAAVVDPGHSTGVAVDPASGDVYVTDRTYVAVYEASGAPVLEGGAPLRIGLGSLGDAYGVAVSDFAATAGYVYVADDSDDLVKVYDPAGDPEHPVATIDGAGTLEGSFTTLRDATLAIDQATGHLFVAFNSQGLFYRHPLAAVAEFNPAGEYRGTLPAPTPLWFGEPSGIAVDNSGGSTGGRVYVTTGNSEFESAGRAPEREEEGAIYAFGPTAPGRRLEVSLVGPGSGSVASDPAGISCPGSCAAEYDEGSAVTLTASPAAGSAFAGWSGDCSGSGACTLSLASAASVTAEFSSLPAAFAAGAASTPASAPRSPATAVPDPGPTATPSEAATRAPAPAVSRGHRRGRLTGRRHRHGKRFSRRHRGAGRGDSRARR